MHIPAQSTPVSKAKWPHALIIRTTLYELISAINAEVDADDDDLAIAAVVHLLKTHWLIYVSPFHLRRSVTDHSQRTRHHRHTTASTARSEWIASRARRVSPSRSWSSAGPLPSIANQRPPADT